MESKILSLAKQKGVEDRFKQIRVKYIKRIIPKYLIREKHIDTFIIYDDTSDTKNYYRQPLVVVPLQEFLQMIKEK